MSISPKGMSILELYELYRTGNIIVDRKYQRKLVWDRSEKEKLIDSIMLDYPLPLFLFAKKESQTESIEILDGMQRLTAIFDFIENRISYNDSFFDITSFPSAQLRNKEGAFTIEETSSKLSQEECINFLGYQLACTTFLTIEEDKMIDVFGRINSQGRQLSLQEKRQAGIINDFSELVREVSATIRGDQSVKSLKLYEMPSISLDDSSNSMGYSINIQSMFWYDTGILKKNNIKNSEDEEMIADLLISIIFGNPFALSREKLDEAYNSQTKLYTEINTKIRHLGAEKIEQDFYRTFDIVKKIVNNSKQQSEKRFDILTSGQYRNPVKYVFYALFMATYYFVIKENKYPAKENYAKIRTQLENLQSKLVKGSHSVKVVDRNQNINIVKGLIQDFFKETFEECQFPDGYYSEAETEKLLSYSKTETEMFEFKQGTHSLEPDKINYNEKVVEKICKTAVAISNLGRAQSGYIFIGISDNEDNTKILAENYGVEPITVYTKDIVGIDWEIENSGLKDIDSYLQKFISKVDTINICEDLKTQLRNLSVISYQGHQIMKIEINSIGEVALYENDVYRRVGAKTEKITGVQEILSFQKAFVEKKNQLNRIG